MSKTADEAPRQRGQTTREALQSQFGTIGAQRIEDRVREIAMEEVAHGMKALRDHYAMRDEDLQRRASEFERMYRNRDGRLEEAKAEIAHLSACVGHLQKEAKLWEDRYEGLTDAYEEKLEEARAEITQVIQSRNDWQSIARDRGKKIDEFGAEIARLRDPRNWKIVRNQAEVIERVEDQFTIRYVGPPESEGESDYDCEPLPPIDSDDK